jgi:nicotinamide-nucleotide amidase
LHHSLQNKNMANVKASIITIGDELLIGQTIDTNSAWIGQRVNELGIEVVRRVAVGDEAEEIKEALDAELDRSAVVFVTGGLGPTADDITKPLLCEYFNGKMIVDEATLTHVKEIFTRRNRPFLDRNIKQAEVPDTCKVLFNKMGTAPGMLFERDGKFVIAMPGVPFEMVSIMEDEALPFLRKQFVSDAFIHRSIITAGEGESFIAERIKDLEEALPKHIKLAYLPSAGMVRLRLTGRGSDEQQLIKELELRQQEIANKLENIVVSLDDLPMEHVLGKSLVAKNATVAFAESCTGGNIGHLITQVMGSGRYFMGSAVCYQNEIKEAILGVRKSTIKEMGAVSEQTAMEMAEGARAIYKSDYSLGVTGKLDAGGEDENVPVGTVWMAVTDKNRTIAKEFKFFYDRPRNKEMAVQMGMLMLWKFIEGKL